MTSYPTYEQAAGHPGVLHVHVAGASDFRAYVAGDELPGPTLAHRRAARWDEIKAHRDALSDAGGYAVVVGGVAKWFHSDPKSKTQQLGLVMAGAGLPPGLQWKTLDGTFVTMTQSLAGQVFQAAMAQDSAIFQAAEAHRAAMEVAPDPAAYDFTAGWPVVFPG